MKPSRLSDVQPDPDAGDQISSPQGLSPSDSLFAMLDGQIIGSGEGAWRAEVVAIHAVGDDMWVQIGPARRPENGVVIRMQRPEVSDAIDALRAWAGLPEHLRPRMIDLLTASGQAGPSHNAP